MTRSAYYGSRSGRLAAAMSGDLITLYQYPDSPGSPKADAVITAKVDDFLEVFGPLLGVGTLTLTQVQRDLVVADCMRKIREALDKAQDF